MPSPSVAVVIPTYNGAHHLPACLDSVAALSYESSLVETIVVDNGSTDGTRELLAERSPWVRVMRLPENVGFAEAINRAAAATQAECLALLNNDMRVEKEWLNELVRMYDPDNGYLCVAGLILDWDGLRVDFADGFVNFHGAAAQDRFGDPVDQVAIEDGRELPFACGGSMLIDRRRFLALGGFDPAYFAFFEDVDLGWRLWLSGDRVRLAARARSFHRHHSTGSALAPHQRLYLFERNWLRTLIKNLDEGNLGRVLSGALLLTGERARLDSGSDRNAFAPGSKAGTDHEAIPRVALARLQAIGDVVDDLEALFELRRAVQRRRVRSDAEIFRTFGRPFYPVREDEPYLAAMTRVTHAFRLDELFPAERANRILVVPSPDPTPEQTQRLGTIAASAARLAPVIFASRNGAAVAAVDCIDARRDGAVEELVREADVVVIDGHDVEASRLAREAGSLLVVDLVDDAAEELIRSADFFLCGSAEEQREWLARIASDGRSMTGPHGEPMVGVLPAQDGETAGALRSIVSEPWRWRAASPTTRPIRVTEDARALLARWRYQYGVARPVAWHVARAAWRKLSPKRQARLRRLSRRR